MSPTNIKVYGTNWCSNCKRSKKFLGQQRVQNGGIPTIVFEDGSLLIEPSNAELAAKRCRRRHRYP